MLGGTYDLSRGSKLNTKSSTISVPKMDRGAKRKLLMADVKDSPFQSIDNCELDSSLYNSSMGIPKKQNNCQFDTMNPRDESMNQSNQFAKNIQLEHSREERQQKFDERKQNRAKCRIEL